MPIGIMTVWCDSFLEFNWRQSEQDQPVYKQDILFVAVNWLNTINVQFYKIKNFLETSQALAN
jgi:hypothetical protein